MGFEPEAGRATLYTGEGSPTLMTENEGMKRLFVLIKRVAARLAGVLIEGETGTGKELVARALHAHSPRARGPFLAVNCAGLSETLLESELFGHKKGAFTGANEDRVGLVEAANGGTLFLDEVSEMSPHVQTKVLRLIQQWEFRRVGDVTARRADVALIAATNKDLYQLVQQGKFREDLYWRLKAVVIRVPPLRERGEDIFPLAEHFMREHSQKHSGPAPVLSLSAKDILFGHSWRGNVRELENSMLHLVSTAAGDTILAEEVENYLRPAPFAPKNTSARNPDAVRKEAILQALRTSKGKREEAAELLGISRKTLLRWMKRSGLA